MGKARRRAPRDRTEDGSDTPGDVQEDNSTGATIENCTWRNALLLLLKQPKALSTYLTVR